MIKRIKRTIMGFPRETSALSASFAFALAGDMIYGGVAGAEQSLVGTVMTGASNLFFTVFLIMVLFRLVSKAFFSEGFSKWARKIEDDREAEIKTGAKKK